ncbi:efflux RND transporter permease subunit [Magnetovibrio blakemorei]|uniref:Multidrug transporter AcrB n=1 Tax=Magnetovibrio blakemorei TaxID=28181 RepID=A0A1E5Q6Y6_9PROT|nr:efflux RND transporter permease subunit [Magnetovibrio blakemorei]OEJ66817.1 multidrug transporter AcrB [Magnetovibrio blakemorei]
MTLTENAIKNKTVSWLVTLLIIGGGILAFSGLGRLEDPEFTIKQAVVVTEYPGASSREVEEEVTLPIENAIQQLPYVKNIQSISSAGLSQVTVEMKSIYRKADLAQIWDEMRRKIRDMQGDLPAGVQTPQINDDFGDVYGIFFSISGAGYSYEELADYTDFLRRELVLVDGVGKVTAGGQRKEQIILEVNRAKMSALNSSPTAIVSLLENQNLVSDAGHLQVGSEYIRISSTGVYDNVEDLNNLMLGRANGQIIYLSDVATVTRTYADPPKQIYRYNGEDALTLGVSFTSGVNVVSVGEAVNARLAELEYARPIGMKIGVIYDQPQQVDTSVTNFLVSLGQAIGIVVVVLLIAMGLRSGILMSLVLLLTILATFIVMNIFAIDLHRISLGALIIALGMLVDNAIVITEGILIGLKRGLTRVKAATRIVSQTVWPLLGATVISIIAFAPIGLSPDASGEFAGSLFWVLLISLMISWAMAITLTPFFANLMFKESVHDEDARDAAADPYQGVFYQVYKGVLLQALRFRGATSALMVSGLALSIYGFTFVSQSFFPPSNLPVFTVDYWLAEGSDIRVTATDMAALEREILANENVTKVTTTVGQGALRFMLTYNGERNYASYGQFIVEVGEFSKVASTRAWVDDLVRERAPQGFSKSDRFFVGPASKAKIEARLSGPDSAVLRKLSDQVIDIFHNDADAINIRHDWRERTKVLRPQFAEAEARRLGISKTDLDNALSMNVSGMTVGMFRDGSTILPILVRPPLSERANVGQLDNIQVFSPALGEYVNIDQVIHGMNLDWEDPLIMRRDRKRTIQVWADEDPLGPTNSFALFERLRPQVESLDLPPGYALEWGGEYEAQKWANEAVFKFVPLGVLVMVFITVLLFNSAKQTVVVWLTVPLSIIGVTTGLLTFNQPFSFTALLGFLSLSGMVLKNGIVLVEEIKRLNEEENATMHDAIADAAVSRLRPVVMAAITTVLGLIPLLSDIFFAPLAVTIMFGLGFATILTLIVVPVLFALFYGVHFHRGEIH